MSGRKNSGFSDLITGVFMLAVLSLLVYFTIIISGVDLITGKEKIDVPVVFDQVGGLKDHDNVMYRGTKVGTVDRIVLGEREVTVVMNIDKDRLIKDLQDHKTRMEWNCQKCLDNYAKGYLQGIDFAIRVVQFQPESEMGQVAFDFDCGWK